nr:secreted RxLR effector protein 161-like [Nicotiana tomentosiformis]
MEIKRDRHSKKLYISQREYLKRVIDRFGMNDNTKSVSTLLAPHFKLSDAMSLKNKAEREYMSRVPYANVVGSLMYAMVCTRPDISYAIGVVRRYMHDPGKEHWQAVKWILWYIRNTVYAGLIFEQEDSQYLVGYCDSDYVDDLDKRRSTTGYTTVALSTTEAQYMKITEAKKEAIWLQEEGGVMVQKIRTTDNPADMLAKVVTAIKFQHCLNLINIVEL